MKNFSFYADRRGVTSIEYAIIAALISVVIISSVFVLGQNVTGTFNSVDTAYTAATVKAAPAPVPAPVPD